MFSILGLANTISHGTSINTGSYLGDFFFFLLLKYGRHWPILFVSKQRKEMARDIGKA